MNLSQRNPCIKRLFTRSPLSAISIILVNVVVVPDKKAACFALAGALKAREFWTITQCEIECCTDKDCNTQAPTLSKDAIPVFKPDGKTKHYLQFAFTILLHLR